MLVAAVAAPLVGLDAAFRDVMSRRMLVYGGLTRNDRSVCVLRRRPMTSFSLATGGHRADRYPSSPRRLRQLVFPQVCMQSFLNSSELGSWSNRNALTRTWSYMLEIQRPTLTTLFFLFSSTTLCCQGLHFQRFILWLKIFESGTENCILRNSCLSMIMF